MGSKIFFFVAMGLIGVMCVITMINQRKESSKQTEKKEEE